MNSNIASLKMFAAALVASVFLAGCTATPLTNAQQQELNQWEENDVLVEEKDPALAAGLGVLPGMGSFYTGHYGKGIFNFLTWPGSVLWDPVSGYNGAQTQNYFATQSYVRDMRDDALDELDERRAAGHLTDQEYYDKRREIREKY